MRDLDRGTLDRFLVEHASVVQRTDTGVELETLARRKPWPAGPFPPPPGDGATHEGLLRIEVVGDAAVRVRYAPDGRIRPGGEHMIVGSLAEPSRVDIQDGDGRVQLVTDELCATINLDPYRLEIEDRAGAGVRIGGPDPNYFAVADSLGTGVQRDPRDRHPVATETFSLRPGHAVYGFGETFLGLDKRGQVVDLWVSDAFGAHTPRLYKAVPFFVSTGGYGVFLHTSALVTAWVGSRSAHEVQVAVQDEVLDYFVFLGSIEEVLGSYTELTGRAPMPPAWSFGWWQSRSSYVSAEEVLGVVREMRAAAIPMDVIHLDTAWFTTDWKCDLEFSPDRFPDPKGFCEELERQGVHLSLWQMPYLIPGSRLYDRLAEVGGFVRDARGNFYDVGIHFVAGYEGPVHCIDWTNPAALAVMQEEYERLLRTGASVLKVDFGESLPLDAFYADGTPARSMHNLYPLRYQKAVFEVTERVRGEGLAWSRSGWAGAQRYPVHWGGDVTAAWDAMLPELHGGLSLGLSGFSFWSADIAGSNELPDDEELIVRWLQWAALLSHARVHGGGQREVYRWKGAAARVARAWIELRYRLLPYILASAAESARAGLPFARPLVLEFQDDRTTWAIGDQFLCGRSLLVAPLLEPGGRRTLYLPEGTWVDWWSRRPLHGGQWIEVEHDLDTAPLFIREGGLIPMGPAMRSVGERPSDPLSIVVAPFSGDGSTTLSWEDASGPVTVSYECAGGSHRVAVCGAPGAVKLDLPEATEVELQLR